MNMKYPKLPKSDKLYIGIDQSLTGTSICLYQDQQLEFHNIKPLYMGVSRISEIYKVFCQILDEHEGQVAGAAIEGYAFSAKGAKFNLGELGGVLRLALYERKIITVEVPPTYLKKFFTGKGNAQKNLMIKEAFKKYDIDLNDDNDCDSFGLSLVAREYFETEVHPLKVYRIETQKSCRQIIGVHPLPMNIKEYFNGMPDVTVAQYEKMRKAAKKELND
jgi:crossover junction endodeoxyribonuclease RuvC